MDSYSDTLCLQARIRDLERELATLRQEKADIFYSLTKDDVRMLMEDEECTIPVDDLWNTWKLVFGKRFSSETIHADMKAILRDILDAFACGTKISS